MLSRCGITMAGLCATSSPSSSAALYSSHTLQSALRGVHSSSAAQVGTGLGGGGKPPSHDPGREDPVKEMGEALHKVQSQRPYSECRKMCGPGSRQDRDGQAVTSDGGVRDRTQRRSLLRACLVGWRGSYRQQYCGQGPAGQGEGCSDLGSEQRQGEQTQVTSSACLWSVPSLCLLQPDPPRFALVCVQDTAAYATTNVAQVFENVKLDVQVRSCAAQLTHTVT